MSDFGRQLSAFAVKCFRDTNGVFVRTAQLAHESIKVGSPVTGSPGQPVDTGTLRGSWNLDVRAAEALITTNIAYAPVIEHNVRAAYDPSGVQPRKPRIAEGGTPRIKSTVGGHHSVKLTVNSFGRLVQQAVREIKRG